MVTLFLALLSCSFKNRTDLENFLAWAWPKGMYEEMLEAAGLDKINIDEYILALKPQARLRVETKAAEFGFTVDWREYRWFCRKYLPCAILSELTDHPRPSDDMIKRIKVRTNYYALRLYMMILSHKYSPDKLFPEDGDFF
jgi:hypothetical protein